jgi:GT2 family glycosyltransferase
VIDNASFIILTTGDRPGELTRALDSIRSQTVSGEIIVVANGCTMPDIGSDVVVVELPDNVGIPAGRNVGIATSHGAVLFFLDDDGFYDSSDVVERTMASFAADEGLGIVSFRIVDPDGVSTQRRHVPRLRVGDPLRPSPVTTFLGGACAVRLEVFQEVGMLPGAFFYAHEETDLAWRAIDAGWTIRYEPGAVVIHPANVPASMGRPVFLTARNRVLLARRHLPVPVALVYVTVWFVLSMARTPDRLSVLSGFIAGAFVRRGRRTPISWRTIYTMTKLGRPPVI